MKAAAAGVPAVALAGLAVDAPGGARLLGPLDLAVEAGEHVLVVGPSGSGKTTLLRAIAGLAVPAAGTVELFGRPASAPGRVLLPPHRREVGLLFQGGALWPHMSVRRTLAFTLRCAGERPDAAALAELLALVRLSGFEERLPASLSGGERQRLALARALASRPRVLLLDEPLGPLDRALRDDLLATLAELHRRLGWTTLHVTHDAEEARAAATRVVALTPDGLLEAAR